MWTWMLHQFFIENGDFKSNFSGSYKRRSYHSDNPCDLSGTTLSTDLTTEFCATTAEATKEVLKVKDTDGVYFKSVENFPTRKLLKRHCRFKIAASNTVNQNIIRCKAPLESPTFRETPFTPTPQNVLQHKASYNNFVTSAIADLSTNTSAGTDG
jgi:hypothetical protein